LTPPSTDNIHAARFIPGSQVIPKARAVIHCGGSGSLYQALLCGAPTLVIPFAAYQRIDVFSTGYALKSYSSWTYQVVFISPSANISLFVFNTNR
jgi:UDP:flavonoid glycosyltransferase YjiC (YdhE family)